MNSRTAIAVWQLPQALAGQVFQLFLVRLTNAGRLVAAEFQAA